METLLNSLKNADRICAEAETITAGADRIQQRLEKLHERKRRCAQLWALSGAGVFLAVNALCAYYLPAADHNIGLLWAVLASVITVVFGCDGEERRLNRVMQTLIANEEQRWEQRNAFLASQAEKLRFLPEEFWEREAVNYLITALSTGAAVSLTEALAQYQAIPRL